MATATLYLHKLVERGADIIVLSEHWLWPFDLYKLDEVHPDFTGLGHADSRLSEETHDKRRGCGGVGILWRKSLDAFPISEIDSKRVCGIRIKKEDDTWMSIIGAYLPCADLGMDYFRDTLAELEKVISDSTNLWGPRGSTTANTQGVLLGELLGRCKLHATSLSNSASGPEYSFHSGDRFTTIDYILTDVEASSCTEQCWTHEDDDLNQSDHLPVSVKLSCNVTTQPVQDHNWIRIDWTKAVKSGALTSFQETLKDRLKPFLGQTHSDVEQLDDEIKHVASLIKDAAGTILPLHKAKRANRFKDRTLSQLCAKSKVAWEAWKNGARPCEGPLYEAKCSTRKEVKKRIISVWRWRRERGSKGVNISSKRMHTRASSYHRKEESHNVRDYV